MYLESQWGPIETFPSPWQDAKANQQGKHKNL